MTSVGAVGLSEGLGDCICCGRGKFFHGFLTLPKTLSSSDFVSCELCMVIVKPLSHIHSDTHALSQLVH